MKESEWPVIETLEMLHRDAYLIDISEKEFRLHQAGKYVSLCGQ